MVKPAPYDLPFDTDSSARFIPWIIALTTFIGSIFMLGMLTFSSLIGKWSMDLTGQATLQMHIEPGLSPEQAHAMKAQVLTYLKRTPGIKAVQPLDTMTTYRLLEPWLGKNIEHLNLPIPFLVALTLQEKEHFDVTFTSNELAKISPGIRITEHEHINQSILRAANGLRMVGHFILTLITLACIGALIFSTYTGLIVHHDIIRILMLVGARPGYVANQFQRHTFKLALKGTLYNYVLLGLVAALMFWFVGKLEFTLPIHDLSISTLGLVLMVVPLVIITVMTITARMTVSYVLAHQS